jgi:hypothetical protein
MIQFTRAPQKVTATGNQFFWEAIVLGGDLRVLDLELSVIALVGESAKVTIALLTSTQNDMEEGWATLGTFTQVDEPIRGLRGGSSDVGSGGNRPVWGVDDES